MHISLDMLSCVEKGTVQQNVGNYR